MSHDEWIAILGSMSVLIITLVTGIGGWLLITTHALKVSVAELTVGMKYLADSLSHFPEMQRDMMEMKAMKHQGMDMKKKILAKEDEILAYHKPRVIKAVHD